MNISQFVISFTIGDLAKAAPASDDEINNANQLCMH